MIKSLHKSAKRLRKLNLPHPGILDLDAFNKRFSLHCYEPSQDLSPFVAHIWIQRTISKDITGQLPAEILSGPSMYLFITKDTAFIHSIVPGTFRYDPKMNDVIAGIKFKPGGFSAFLEESLPELAEKTIPVSTVFPEIDTTFRSQLLASTDATIVQMFEDILHKKRPVVDKNIKTIDEVMNMLENDEPPQTGRDIAKRIGKSERSLQLLFQTRVGIPIKWVLTRQRLLRTIHDVTTHHMTWTNAAAEQGYSSQSHFVRDFKKIIGVPPSKYLKMIRTD